MRRALIVLALAGCGARSAPELDEGVAPRLLDAGLDARAALDAPTACPPPSSFGFDMRPGPDFVTLDAPYGAISLGGDGVTVRLAAELRAMSELAIVVRGLDGVGVASGRGDLHRGVRSPRVSVSGGGAHMFALEPGLHVRAEDLETSESSRTEIVRGPLASLGRPAWNGAELVLAGQNGFEVVLGPFTAGGVMPLWRSFGPATDVHVAADPSSGLTALLLRDGAGALRVESFAMGGAALRPPGGTVLEDVGLTAPLALALLEDGTGQPWVLAGFARGDDGVPRATLRRFRTDGSAAGGFSTPIAGAPGAVDLTTVAPVGHRRGYGMVAASRGGGAIFHGAGEDFVGDARPVPVSCDAEHVSIASGPCGYLIACTDGALIRTALAIPPRPR